MNRSLFNNGKSSPNFATTRLRGFSALVEASSDGAEQRFLYDRTLEISWQARCRHILVMGKPGSGKTTKALLPIAFSDIEDPERTVVFVDAQAADFHRIIEHTRRVRGKNARIIYVNPQDPNYSCAWNPLANAGGRQKSYELASALTAALRTSSNETEYFKLQGVKYIAAAIRGLNEATKGNATGGALRALFDAGPKALVEFARATGTPELEAFAGNLTGYSPNDSTSLNQIHNGLLTWMDEDVEKITSADDFDFKVLEDEPCVLIYALPEEAVDRLRPITNAFLHRFFQFVMEQGRRSGGSLRRPVTLIIDEFASAVGEIQGFPLRANTLRKRGLAILAAVQSLRSAARSYA